MSTDFKLGDFITLGQYPQTSDGEVRPLEWRILNIEGNHALVVCKNAIECLPFHKDFEPTTWEACTLRSWLNGDFLNKAFSVDELNTITDTLVSADCNPQHDTEQGADTTDKVFLLSVSEAEKYYADDKDRICWPTPYANAQGVWKWDGSGACDNWLRTMGGSEYGVTDIIIFGTIRYDGASVRGVSSGVRPAMTIDLSTLDY